MTPPKPAALPILGSINNRERRGENMKVSFKKLERKKGKAIPI